MVHMLWPAVVRGRSLLAAHLPLNAVLVAVGERGFREPAGPRARVQSGGSGSFHRLALALSTIHSVLINCACRGGRGSRRAVQLRLGGSLALQVPAMRKDLRRAV